MKFMFTIKCCTHILLEDAACRVICFSHPVSVAQFSWGTFLLQHVQHPRATCDMAFHPGKSVLNFLHFVLGLCLWKTGYHFQNFKNGKTDFQPAMPRCTCHGVTRVGTKGPYWTPFNSATSSHHVKMVFQNYGFKIIHTIYENFRAQFLLHYCGVKLLVIKLTI